MYGVSAFTVVGLFVTFRNRNRPTRCVLTVFGIGLVLVGVAYILPAYGCELLRVIRAARRQS